MCFCTTLQNLNVGMSFLQDEPLERDDKYYEVSQTPIKDKSILGTHGQELCDNLDVHWMIQTCYITTNNTSKCTYNAENYTKNVNISKLIKEQ